ncbi:uncharacterized protein CIMG_11027 [Coccidioides immitis RS]|uniref:Uncharacterized protein n=1 Tax=Coccidioides immitis (strain RS) TaxID=246410 RepID=A0A0D8JRG5_COCIM|nr:uncharacterized protein CIMG_11027 [Coccidioides immitis RS]KJF59940.1 hypothetical protein CIMG_11027 [Coccidioides immitis RS]
MCIPVNITKAGWTVELAFTVPLPYKVSEETYPGNVEARIRSEPATYTRISKNCTDVSIPKRHTWQFFCPTLPSVLPPGHPRRIALLLFAALQQ